jgi:DNA modification methylase
MIGDDVEVVPTKRQKPSALVDTRVIYCGDNLEQLRKLPDACVDRIYIDPPLNSNRNYEVFWGETKEKRAFETAMRRSKREKGFFIAFDYTEDALREIDRFFKADHAVIIPLTVQEILDEQIARKLV